MFYLIISRAFSSNVLEILNVPMWYTYIIITHAVYLAIPLTSDFHSKKTSEMKGLDQ